MPRTVVLHFWRLSSVTLQACSCSAGLVCSGEACRLTVCPPSTPLAGPQVTHLADLTGHEGPVWQVRTHLSSWASLLQAWSSWAMFGLGPARQGATTRVPSGGSQQWRPACSSARMPMLRAPHLPSRCTGCAPSVGSLLAYYLQVRNPRAATRCPLHSAGVLGAPQVWQPAGHRLV